MAGMDFDQRQDVLDALVGLLAVRQAAIGTLGTDRAVGRVRIVATGDRKALGTWTMQQSHRWRHLLSTRPGVSGEGLARSLPNNRYICGRDLRMVSIFDYDSTEEPARVMLDREPLPVYRFAYAPAQMRIVDRREVLLEGPRDSERSSIISLTSPVAIRAAARYWNAVLQTSTPCRCGLPGPELLADRQRAVLELLRRGMTDDRIAEVLGISVRTVRTEVGRAMETLDVRSRFAAGYAYARLAGRVGLQEGAVP
jgi:DNA-binding CsgD family transcriptional regulator